MKQYFLRDDIMVFFDSDVTFRIRKGVWNYTEAVIGLQNEPESVQNIYKKIVDSFITQRKCDVEPILLEAGIDDLKKSQVLTNLKILVQQGYLQTEDQSLLQKSLVNLLSFSFEGIDKINYVQPGLFIGEEGCSNNIARFLSSEIGYPLDILDSDSMKQLSTADLLTKSEAMEHLKQEESLLPLFEPYSVIMGCFMRPPVMLLRNLNRLLVKLRKPFILGFVDGPFLSIVSMASPETACFECFEKRVMARLEDVSTYKTFVKATSTYMADKNKSDGSYSPLLSMLISAVLSEGFLTSSIKINKTSGRIINVYLPSLEIQVQDLLRVPYCPACGSVAAADMDELYTSGRVLIDTMLEKIEVIEKN